MIKEVKPQRTIPLVVGKIYDLKLHHPDIDDINNIDSLFFEPTDEKGIYWWKGFKYMGVKGNDLIFMDYLGDNSEYEIPIPKDFQFFKNNIRMNKKPIKEAQYDEFFPPETVKILKGKSVESRKKMLGNKTLMQSIILTNQVISAISKAEADYIPELEALAVQLVEEAYPIILDQDIKINAKIVGLGEASLPFDDENEDEPLIPVNDTDLPDEEKRRIINGITQGAAIRGGYAISLFSEYLDAIDESLLEKYREVLNLTLGIYDDDEAIAMLLAMLAQKQKIEGGNSEGGFDEEQGTLVINAKGINFAILVYEIVKGLYEIVSLHGFTTDKEKNKNIVKNVDKLANEPDDLRYGKFIYDGISKLYNDSNIDDSRVREYLFTEIYKLPNDEFKSFILNIINDNLSPEQKKWAIDTMKDIKRDLTKDDTNLDDLD